MTSTSSVCNTAHVVAAVRAESVASRTSTPTPRSASRFSAVSRAVSSPIPGIFASSATCACKSTFADASATHRARSAAAAAIAASPPAAGTSAHLSVSIFPRADTAASARARSPATLARSRARSSVRTETSRIASSRDVASAARSASHSSRRRVASPSSSSPLSPLSSSVPPTARSTENRLASRSAPHAFSASAHARPVRRSASSTRARCVAKLASAARIHSFLCKSCAFAIASLASDAIDASPSPFDADADRRVNTASSSASSRLATCSHASARDFCASASRRASKVSARHSPTDALSDAIESTKDWHREPRALRSAMTDASDAAPSESAASDSAREASASATASSANSNRAATSSNEVSTPEGDSEVG